MNRNINHDSLSSGPTIPFELQVANAYEAFELECVDSTKLAAEKPSVWFMKNLIRKGQAGILGGPWKGGKSFLALHVAQCIPRGLNPLNPSRFKAALNTNTGHIRKAGSVLYIASEDGGSLRNRVIAWETKYDPNGELQRKTDHKVWWSRKPLNLLDPVCFEATKRFCKEKGIVFVIIDTLASTVSSKGYSVGNAENDNCLMTLLIETFSSLVGAIDGAGFFIHHPPKGDASTSRGAGAIDASSRFKLLITSNGDNRRTLSLAFNNDAETDGLSFAYSIESIVVGTDPEDGSEIRAGVFVPDTSSVNKPSEQEEKILRCAAEINDARGVITRSDLKRKLKNMGIVNIRTPLARLKDKELLIGLGSPDRSGCYKQLTLTEKAFEYLGINTGVEAILETNTLTLSGGPIWP